MKTALTIAGLLLGAALACESKPAQSPDSAGSSDSVPCTQEIARTCEPGMVDACLVQPPAATTHVCVKKP
jgi:hypothetical protein